MDQTQVTQPRGESRVKSTLMIGHFRVVSLVMRQIAIVSRVIRQSLHPCFLPDWDSKYVFLENK